jgi:hypothetical protein
MKTLAVIALALWCWWAIDKLGTENLYLKAQLEELQAKHNILVDVTEKIWRKI